VVICLIGNELGTDDGTLTAVQSFGLLGDNGFKQFAGILESSVLGI